MCVCMCQSVCLWSVLPLSLFFLFCCFDVSGCCKEDALYTCHALVVRVWRDRIITPLCKLKLTLDPHWACYLVFCPRLSSLWKTGMQYILICFQQEWPYHKDSSIVNVTSLVVVFPCTLPSADDCSSIPKASSPHHCEAFWGLQLFFFFSLWMTMLYCFVVVRVCVDPGYPSHIPSKPMWNWWDKCKTDIKVLRGSSVQKKEWRICKVYKKELPWNCSCWSVSCSHQEGLREQLKAPISYVNVDTGFQSLQKKVAI